MYDPNEDDAGENFKMLNTTNSFVKTVGAISGLQKVSKITNLAKSTALSRRAIQKVLRVTGISTAVAAAQKSVTPATPPMSEKRTNMSTSVVYLESRHDVSCL